MLRVLTLCLSFGLPALALANPPTAREETAATRQAREAIRAAERQATQLPEALRAEREALERIPRDAEHPRLDLPGHDTLGPVLGVETTRLWSLSEDSAPPPLLLLVSFSLPEASLRALAEDAARLKAPLVLRGLVNDSMEDTAQRVAAFSKQTGIGFAIDPTLFSRFGADRVPTLILPLESLRACTEQDCPAPAHVRVTGEASLAYLLEQVERRAAQPQARERAKALRLKLGTP